MLFSILIPTLTDRRDEYLDPLMKHLSDQIEDFDEVEIVTAEDQGQSPTGVKRNDLIRISSGKFVAFVDDDDWVSDTYVPDILTAIKQHEDLHCIGFFGETYFQGELGGIFIHSLMCGAWTERPGWYFRPPNHLNPIRRDLIKDIRYKPVTISEDHFWTLEVAKTGRLKNELFLGQKPTYIYKCREVKKGL